MLPGRKATSPKSTKETSAPPLQRLSILPFTGTSCLCNSTIRFHPASLTAFSYETIISPVFALIKSKLGLTPLKRAGKKGVAHWLFSPREKETSL